MTRWSPDQPLKPLNTEARASARAFVSEPEPVTQPPPLRWSSRAFSLILFNVQYVALCYEKE
jgi:hypothetical protein